MPDRAEHNPRTVVVGVDGTEAGLRAVDHAASQLRGRDARLLLLHVVPEVAASVGGPTGPGAVFLRAGERALASARARATGAGVRGSIETLVRRGPVTSALVKASKSADLIVLGRRGISGLDRLFAGSTSTSVGARAKCPVVIVPHAWRPAERGRVVVGVDGSTRSLPALGLAVTEAVSRSAELVVVHAWRIPASYDVNVPEVEEAVGHWRRSAERAVIDTVTGWSKRHPDLHVSHVFERVHPVESLVDHSAGADLLVIGTRGGGGISGLALGSVARAVVAGSCCPVLLVRRAPRTSAGVRDQRSEPGSKREPVVGGLSMAPVS